MLPGRTGFHSVTLELRDSFMTPMSAALTAQELEVACEEHRERRVPH